MPRVHTFSYFDSAEVWTLQNIDIYMKRRDGFSFQMTLVKCFFRRSYISTLSLALLLPRLSSIDLSSLLNFFFTRCERGVISLEGDGKFCVINQGISCTKVVLNYNKFIKLVGLSSEEMLSFEYYDPCDVGPLFPLDEHLHRRLVLHQ